MFRKTFYNLLKRIIAFYNSETIRQKMGQFQLSNVHLSEGYLDGNVILEEGTYINRNYRIVSGRNSKVEIGSHCAIGRNFNCSSRTHDLVRPTSDKSNLKHKIIEKDISIGRSVWIGDNVLIKPGITVKDFAIIGANSVVTKDVGEFEIVGGVPAKHIRFNTDHYLYKVNSSNKK